MLCAKLLLSVFWTFVWQISLSQSQINPNYRILPYSVNPVQYPRVVPPLSSKKQDSFDIKQVRADELPPGEYEILAMFDGKDGVKKPAAPVDRSDTGKSIMYKHNHQVEYVRPPGSIFEAYSRKSNAETDEPVRRSHSPPPATSYAHQNIQYSTHRESYPTEDVQYDDQRQDYYKPSLPVTEIKSLPRRDPLPIIENTYRGFAPTPTPTPYTATSANSIPVDEEPAVRVPILPTPPPHHRNQVHARPEEFAVNGEFVLPDNRQPVKKEASPFRFPDEPPRKSFAPSPVPSVQHYRRPEPELVYEEADDASPALPPVKRKIVSRPEENAALEQFVRPVEQFSRPEEQFVRPVEQFTRPAEQFDRPVEQFSRPADQFDRPVEQFSRPAEQFGRPAEQFSRPEEQFNRPVEQFSRPAEQFNRHEEQSRPEEPSRLEEQFSRPKEQFSRPVNLFSRPVEPTVRPVDDVSEPAEEIDRPVALPDDRRRKVPRVIDSNKARNPLDRLKEIAGDSDKNPVTPGGKTKPKSSEETFICPHDGHFGDPKDCSKFYRCAHGTPLPDFCPGELFWNTATEQCDWPEQTTCQFDPSSPEIREVEQPTYVYLTFDDGPNEGTENVLNALEAEGIKATFFINSDRLYDPIREKAERNARSLLRLVDSGHTLADHSFNHMKHNSIDSPVNAYMNVERDLNYFGPANINPVLDLLWGNDRKDERLLHFVNTTMMGLVRMPYTNNWRIPEAKIHSDCGTCTTPTTSGQRGIEIANRLSSEGRYVVGWDLEWAMDFKQNRNQYGGSVSYMKLRTRHTKSPRKVVLLTHDVAYRPGGARDEENELKTFIQLAKKSGYTFRTLDSYATDNVNV